MNKNKIYFLLPTLGWGILGNFVVESGEGGIEKGKELDEDVSQESIVLQEDWFLSLAEPV